MAEDNGLFPVIDIEDLIDEEEEASTEYQPSPMWDLERGDFVRNGKNDVPYAEGEEAIKIWCVKMIQTQRYECLAYDDDIGCDLSEALHEDDEEALASNLERTITEALEINPRIDSIDNFEVELEGSRVYITLTVNLVDFDAFDIQTSLDAEDISDDYDSGDDDGSDEDDESDEDEE